MRVISSLFLIYLRLNPLVIGVMAVLVLAGGGLLQMLENNRLAERARIVLAGPPEEVEIGAFDGSQVSPLGEARLRAQFDLAEDDGLVLRQPGTGALALAVPLLEETATGPARGAPGVALLHKRDFDPDRAVRYLNTAADRRGAVGPVLALSGTVGDAGIWAPLLEAALAETGRSLAPGAVVFLPFIGSRSAALMPPRDPDGTVFGAMSKVACVLGLFALLKLAIRHVPDAPARVPVPAADRPVAAPARAEVLPPDPRPVPPCEATGPRRVVRRRREGAEAAPFAAEGVVLTRPAPGPRRPMIIRPRAEPRPRLN